MWQRNVQLSRHESRPNLVRDSVVSGYTMSGVEPDRAGGPARTVSSYPLRDFRHIPIYPKSSRLQAKLMVGSPDDIYELEADSVAQRVTLTSGTQLQRTCDCGGTCPACRNTKPDSEAVHLQTKPVDAEDEDIG